MQQVCYYQALEDVYERFCEKLGKTEPESTPYDAKSHDYFVFHAPYNKLVQKSYGRLFFLDARRRQQQRNGEDAIEEEGFESEWLTKPLEETYADKLLEKACKQVSKISYEQRLKDANKASQLVGNTYTASVFFGLASLIDRAGGRGDLTPGKSIAVFSYGSGALATMYRLTVREPLDSSRFSVEKMAGALKLMDRLESREKVHPNELDQYVKNLKSIYCYNFMSLTSSTFCLQKCPGNSCPHAPSRSTVFPSVPNRW